MPFEISNHQEGTCDARHSDLAPVGAPQLPLVGVTCALSLQAAHAVSSTCDNLSLSPGGLLLSSGSAYEALLPEATRAPGPSVPAQVKGSVLYSPGALLRTVHFHHNPFEAAVAVKARHPHNSRKCHM